MDNRFFYQAGAISFGVYFLFLIFLIFYFNYTRDESKAYSFRQETFFEVSLSDLQVVKKQKNIQTKQEQVNNSKTKKIIKEDGSLTHKRGVNFNSLFNNIKEDSSDNKLDDYDLETSKAEQISRKYGQKNKTLSNKALTNIDKSLEQIKLPTSYSNNAIYNEYYSKINKLLTVEFNRKVTMKGSYKSVVFVTIDSSGSFSYLINKQSSSDIFNFKLEEFLKEIQTRVFPPYEKGSTVIKVIFEIKE